MNLLKSTLLFASIIIISSCETQKKADKSPSKAITGVIGSWNLNRFVDHPNKGKDWVTYDDSILYQKHITETHFTCIKYDKENDQLLGMGGGNYKLEDGKYVENIEFFYPPGSSELDQSIPFDMVFDGNEWFHTGFANETELDIETGEMEITGKNKIEEVWTPTELNNNPESNIYGTWDLLKYRDSLGGEYIEYPEFTGYIKLITPTHFVWTKYDKDGDEIYGAGAGPYIFDGGKYFESIQVIHPVNTGQVGSVIKFEIEANDNQWMHFGYVPDYQVDEATGQIVNDSILIDEYWIPHETEFSEEIFF